MKKLKFVALIALIAVALTGCGADDDEQAAPSPTPETTINQASPPTLSPSPTPTPEPEATPFPRVAVEDYVMIWKNDTTRGINYKIPVHWQLQQSDNRYLVYYEPTPEGELGFRLYLSNKKVSTEPNSSAMRTNLNKILEGMEQEYADFESDGKISRDYKLVRFSGYSTYYTFTDEYGVKNKGFVIIATYNRRIYCMNFSGPEARFNEMQGIGVSILESISRVT